MIWVNFLHFYQPHNQQKDILNRIVQECYTPVLKGLLSRPTAKVVINVNGALLQLLRENKYDKVLEMFSDLVISKRAEFTGSAMYHALLPLLPEKEIVRQIHQNLKICQEILGTNFSPKGFFSPEMAVNDNLLHILKDLGYEWTCASDLANLSGNNIGNNMFLHSSSKMKIYFRNKRLSSLVLSGVVHTPHDLIEETEDIIKTDSYAFSVMDAETFGHHRIGHDAFLFNLYDSGLFEFGLPEDIEILGLPTVSTNIRSCTWTNEEQDFWLEKEHPNVNSFILWKDPSNEIHLLQWELTDYTISKVEEYSDKNSEVWIKARDLLDKALASDQYWWASVKPWWSLEMVEQGAFALKEVLEVLYGETSPEALFSDSIYRKILDKAFNWQRSGYIRDKHLKNSGTYLKEPLKDRTPAEWFNQIVLEFEDEMSKAAKKQDYEKAIKWRDALIKINLGTDIFDVLHVLDELNWTTRRIPMLKPFLTYEWEELPPYARKFLAGVSTKEEFDNWKAKTRSVILEQ